MKESWNISKINYDDVYDLTRAYIVSCVTYSFWDILLGNSQSLKQLFGEIFIPQCLENSSLLPPDWNYTLLITNTTFRYIMSPEKMEQHYWCYKYIIRYYKVPKKIEQIIFLLHMRYIIRSYNVPKKIKHLIFMLHAWDILVYIMSPKNKTPYFQWFLSL